MGSSSILVYLSQMKAEHGLKHSVHCCRSHTINNNTYTIVDGSFIRVAAVSESGIEITAVSEELQRYSSTLPQGFKDQTLENSPGWWAVTVATSCPSRPSQLLATTVTQHCDRLDE